MTLSPHTWLVFLACAFGAEVAGTMAGFGAATILTPIAMFFMDAKTAVAVVACFHLFGNASRLTFFGRHIHWKTARQFGLAGIAAGVPAAWVAARLPSETVRLLFGAFLLFYVGASVFGPRRFQVPRTAAVLVGGGVVSGFIAGLIGTGGAVRSACLLAFGLTRETYLGTSAAIALAVDATRLPVYLSAQLIPARAAPLVISLVATAFCGAWLGQRMVQRISAAAFRRLILGMLCLAGVKLVSEGLGWG